MTNKLIIKKLPCFMEMNLIVRHSIHGAGFFVEGKLSKANKLIGKRFGRWKILEFSSTDKHHNDKYICECDCGTIKTVSRQSLKNGSSKSCGCLQKELQSKHNMYGTPEYKAWQNIKTRCYNKNTPYYKNYGDRGITVYNRWLKSFDNFYKDMGDKPSDRHSIERINNNKGYSPNNCYWATYEDQQHNTRIQKNNLTGVRGVCFIKSINKYMATITVNRKSVHIGCFNLLTEAEKARKEAELIYWDNQC